jgi:hypothetical protein
MQKAIAMESPGLSFSTIDLRPIQERRMVFDAVIATYQLFIILISIPEDSLPLHVKGVSSGRRGSTVRVGEPPIGQCDLTIGIEIRPRTTPV